MATQDDVRRIALALPQVEVGEDYFAFSVPTRGKQRGFAWVWMERVAPKKPRVAQPAVLAVRVANIEEKEALLALGDECYFTEPHYNGFPAILVRLAAIEVDELEALLIDAWRCMAPKQLLAEYDAR